jgi:signal transduction histidine kinase
VAIRKFWPERLTLAKKLVFLVLVTSTIATTLTSLVQIVFEYEIATDSQNSAIAVFQSSAKSGIQNSLWNYNEEALRGQLKSSLATKDFIEIRIYDEAGAIVAVEAKEGKFKNSEKTTVQLMEPTNPSEKIGSLELIYTNDFIIEDLIRRSIWIIVTNFIKTMVVVSLLMNFFYQFFVKRINFIASTLNQEGLGNTELNLKKQQPWPFHSTDDEITDLELAMIGANQTIMKSNQALKESALSSARLAELGIFASGVAHEVNNPLMIILGNVSLIEKQVEDARVNPQIVQKNAERIAASAMRIKKIISALGSLSRDGTNDPMEELSVRKVVDDTMALCETMLAKRQIKFSCVIEPEDLIINCRMVQLTQIILNLINNAGDAIAELDEKWIEVRFWRSGPSTIACTVTDSGHGIPEEVLNKIFVPFFTTKAVGKGTGLGLAIVQSMVERQNGKISVNREHKNTQFVIEFCEQQVRLHAA